MKIQTYLFGEVEVDPNKVITFPNGLVGFEGSKRFMLAHEDDKGEASSYTLQSVDNPNVAFQIVDPAAIGFHYELNLTDAETALLEKPAAEDVAVMLMVFKRESDDAKGIAANFRAPLVFNTKARVAVQKPIQQVRTNVTISNLASSV